MLPLATGRKRLHVAFGCAVPRSRQREIANEAADNPSSDRRRYLEAARETADRFWELVPCPKR